MAVYSLRQKATHNLAGGGYVRASVSVEFSANSGLGAPRALRGDGSSFAAHSAASGIGLSFCQLRPPLLQGTVPTRAVGAPVSYTSDRGVGAPRLRQQRGLAEELFRRVSSAGVVRAFSPAAHGLSRMATPSASTFSAAEFLSNFSGWVGSFSSAWLAPLSKRRATAHRQSIARGG